MIYNAPIQYNAPLLYSGIERFDVLTRRTIDSGSRSFGPWSLPDDVVSVVFRIDRCTSADNTTWNDPSTIILCTPWVSYDGGINWSLAGRFADGGGVSAFQRDGVPGESECMERHFIPRRIGPGRWIMLDVQASAQVRTGISIEYNRSVDDAMHWRNSIRRDK